MKHIISIFMFIICLLFITNVCAMEYEPDFDYANAMIRAACVGDEYSGNELCRLRRMKMADMEISDNLRFDCLYLLAKVIYTEAGSSWITEEHRKLVGSVVLNRIASPEFPNTMYEVVYQRGQYGGVTTGMMDSVIPSEACVKTAFDLIVNGSVTHPSVVFQAEFPQGSAIYKTIYDSYLGMTYFCYSNNMNLY